MTERMTSMQRVLTALGHGEADRVPFFLLLTTQGAREQGLSIRNYFGRPDQVVEAQMRLRARYGHDCLYAFYYASIEIEAMGGTTAFVDDGPPNAGPPILPHAEVVFDRAWPSVESSASLDRVLETISSLKTQVGDEVPILGVVMSPFSIPVMQMGFGPYLDLLYEAPPALERLLQINETFCVAWANAQLAAGATAIVYFDPVASPTVVPVDTYRRLGLPVARRVFSAVKGPMAVHLASGRALAIVDDLVSVGAVAAGAGSDEDLSDLAPACAGRIALVGNLNGIAMRRWTPEEARQQVRTTIAKAAPGGGFILSDSHGEIPWSVPDEVIQTIADAAREFGAYPMTPADV